MAKNIYNMFREYNRILTKPQKVKYLTSLSYDTRETFKSFLEYSNNSDRFENIYDGWIDNIESEIVVLEVYSTILKTQRDLEKFCVPDEAYNTFIQNKKEMLLSLLSNKQYTYASKLLEIHMFSNAFKEKKLIELKTRALAYIKSKGIPLPKKLIEEIYVWAESRKLPSYLITDISTDFKFQIRHDFLPLDTLKEDIEEELKTTKLPKIVDNLVACNKIS